MQIVLNIIDKFKIAGRGDVFTISLKENGIPPEKALDWLGQNDFENDGVMYKIINIEYFSNLMNGAIMDRLGLVLRKLS